MSLKHETWNMKHETWSIAQNELYDVWKILFVWSECDMKHDMKLREKSFAASQIDSNLFRILSKILSKKIKKFMKKRYDVKITK